MAFGTLHEQDFFGRAEELTDLYRRALQAERGIAQSVFLSGSRGIGKTELLKQLFSHLFWKQDRVVPFTYSVNNALLSAADFSRDYIARFICQRLAFETKDQSLLNLDGVSYEGLSGLIEANQTTWAREILDRYVRSSGKPTDLLRAAVNAPYQSALATGKPVAILIDEFQRLKNLRINGTGDPQLVSLFEAPLAYKGTVHMITGNEAEIQEMPISGYLSRVTLAPLGIEQAAPLFLSLLHAYGMSIEEVPQLIIQHFGGNPFYIRCMATAVASNSHLEERDFWTAYVREITGGNIYLYWSSVLKHYFPDLGRRKNVLDITHKMYHTQEPFTQEKIVETFSPACVPAEETVRNLHHSGLIHGEFGLFRKPEDGVLTDFVDFLYLREMLGKSPYDIEKEFLERSSEQKPKGAYFELTIPMIREAELVAARCLEQIGKNLRLQEETIGQLQLALIEACINAIEHSKSGERTITVTFDVTDERIEASVESSGKEFIVQETGEPFVGKRLSDETGRGWGVKLMKRFTDGVRFEKTVRGTKVILLKKIPATAGIYKEVTADGE